VRFVLHTPTVFAIATKDVMLLNPYPYGTEAFRSFCVTVRKSSAIGANRARERDIYEQYEHYHFGEPWAHAEQIDPNVWDDLGVSSPALDPDLGGGPRTPLNNANRTVGPTVTDASLGRPG